MFLGVKIQFLTAGVWALLGDFYWVFLLGSIQSLGCSCFIYYYCCFYCFLRRVSRMGGSRVLVFSSFCLLGLLGFLVFVFFDIVPFPIINIWFLFLCSWAFSPSIVLMFLFWCASFRFTLVTSFRMLSLLIFFFF